MARGLDPAGLISVSQVLTGLSVRESLSGGQALLFDEIVDLDGEVVEGTSQGWRIRSGTGEVCDAWYSTRLCSRVRKMAVASPKSVTL